MVHMYLNPRIKEMEIANYDILAPVPSGRFLRITDKLGPEEEGWVKSIKYALDNREMMVGKAAAFRE